MFQWLFTILGAVNKLAEATLSIAEAVDASAQTLKAAALDSIESEEIKNKLIEADEFNRYAIKTKKTIKAMAEYRRLKQGEQPQQQEE